MAATSGIRTRARGSSLAHHAPQRDDAAHLRHLALRADALRCRHAGDLARLLRGAPDSARISDRRWRETRRDRRKLLQARLGALDLASGDPVIRLSKAVRRADTK